MKKENYEVRFKVTKEQYDKLKTKSSKLGMNLKSYLLYLGLTADITLRISNNVD